MAQLASAPSNPPTAASPILAASPGGLSIPSGVSAPCKGDPAPPSSPPPPRHPRASHPSTHTRYPEGFAHGWREMELIREAEWIITCFLKRAVCGRLLWSGLFIGCVSNLNKESEFHRFAPGDDAGRVPVGCRPPSLMLPRHPQPLGGCSNTFRSK